MDFSCNNLCFVFFSKNMYFMSACQKNMFFMSSCLKNTSSCLAMQISYKE